MIGSHIQLTMDTLLSLSTNAVVKCMTSQYASLVLLPYSIKTELLNLATKRGILNSKILQCLVNADVHNLDLNECCLTEEDVQALTVCRCLRKLILNSLKKDTVTISPSVMMDTFHCFPFLNELHLQNCTTLTDDVVVVMAANCPLLRCLDLGGCTALTDESLFPLSNLSSLSLLNLSYTQVTNVGIRALTTGKCRHTLSELYLVQCLGVVNLCIMDLITTCPQLTVLMVHGCPNYAEMEPLDIKLKHLSWTV